MMEGVLAGGKDQTARHGHEGAVPAESSDDTHTRKIRTGPVTKYSLLVQKGEEGEDEEGEEGEEEEKKF